MCGKCDNDSTGMQQYTDIGYFYRCTCVIVKGRAACIYIAIQNKAVLLFPKGLVAANKGAKK